jgi:fumarylacetoacetate (FAA) hydrolase
MKLASLKGGRDGRLVLVSDDLAYFAYAGHIATTLQDVLDNWEMLSPKLELLATDLAHAVIPRERFHERDAASPLPRAYSWITDGAEQASAAFTSPRDSVPAGGEAQSRIVVVTDDVLQGSSAADCASLIRLVGLSLTCGPSTSFSPVFVTPESLGIRWSGDTLHGALASEVSGHPTFRTETSTLADFGALVAAAASSRALAAGTLIGSDPVPGAAAPSAAGDSIRIWMDDDKHHPIFGVIEQRFV